MVFLKTSSTFVHFSGGILDQNSKHETWISQVIKRRMIELLPVWDRAAGVLARPAALFEFSGAAENMTFARWKNSH
jgi:ABC-type uncharacterized transport system YnjBCD ATPase subunit